MGTQDYGFRKTWDITLIEKERTIIQRELDSTRSIEYRKKLGQFPTPYELAEEIAEYSRSLVEGKEINFLEPSIGTGAFFSALLSVAKDKSISATGVEIDNGIYEKAQQIWKNYPLKLINADFTELNTLKNDYNLILANPPYVRNQYIEQEKKKQLSEKVYSETGIRLSGLSGLYCYFILLSHKWLAPNAISCWLIPNEFMDVNYGRELKNYLLNKVQLLRIHIYNLESSKFKDALVSSTVIWFKNTPPDKERPIVLSAGESLKKPFIERNVSRKLLEETTKWSTLLINCISNHKEAVIGDYFIVKRGIATGDNSFFILNENEKNESGIEDEFFTPILPSPRALKENIINSDAAGIPGIQNKLYLLDCTLPIEEAREHTALWEYLQKGENSTANNYLCRNRRVWYWQEKREPTFFLCSYMGREGNGHSTPFRFILNNSRAIASNSYLMLYPKEPLKMLLEENPNIIKAVWIRLQEIKNDDFFYQWRVYGGGLKKIEPKELSRVSIPNLEKLFR